MTEFTQMGAFAALLCTCVAIMMYTTKLTNDLGDQIVTGFIRDRPISIEQRWLMLYGRWWAYVMTAVAFPLILAFAVAIMADHTGSADSRLVGRLAAFGFVVGAATWVVGGFVHLTSYRRVLRQAEAD
jgi:ABC-type Fe3+ transport system permease subunit